MQVRWDPSHSDFLIWDMLLMPYHGVHDVFFSPNSCAFSLGPTSPKLSEVGVLQLHHLGWRFTRKWCKICWRKWSYVRLPHGSRSLQAILVSRNKKVMTWMGCVSCLRVWNHTGNMGWCLTLWLGGSVWSVRFSMVGQPAKELRFCFFFC